MIDKGDDVINELIVEKKEAFCFRITQIDEDGCEVGYVYLYILNNDKNKGPIGYIEDLFVSPSGRGKGYAVRLMKKLEEIAISLGCYKIVGCFRYSREEELGRFYGKLGYDCGYGVEFRKDLK